MGEYNAKNLPKISFFVYDGKAEINYKDPRLTRRFVKEYFSKLSKKVNELVRASSVKYGWLEIKIKSF